MTQSLANSLPLSRWPVLATNQPLRARDHLSRLFRPHRITLGGRRDSLNFQHNRAEFGGISLNALRYGSEVTVTAPTLSDSYLLKFTLRGTSEVRQGRNIYATTEATVCVLNPTCALVDHMSPEFDMLIVQIEGAQLRQVLECGFGITVHQALEFESTPYPLHGSIGSFTRMVRSICEDIDTGTTSLTCPQVQAPLVRTLTSLVLTELPHNYSTRLPRSDRLPAPRFIRAVEDYIDAHLTGSIALEDLLVAAGTSARTLQTGFMRYHGTSPMHYLRDRRLDRAHAEIRRRPDARVTDIAIECGFNHLGRFAQQYRARFQQAPSQGRR
jgi:AraC-like DNA-binding protein